MTQQKKRRVGLNTLLNFQDFFPRSYSKGSKNGSTLPCFATQDPRTALKWEVFLKRPAATEQLGCCLVVFLFFAKKMFRGLPTIGVQNMEKV